MGKDSQANAGWIHMPNTWGQTSRWFTISLIACITFLPCVFSVRSRMAPPGHEIILARDSIKESHKVLTTNGLECRFPFRLGGTIHHQCISVSSRRPWCSLTHNFDRDHRWGFCTSENSHPNDIPMSRWGPDPCAGDPCWHGGLCTRDSHNRTFECSCPEGYSGRRCEERQCYDETHLRYYDSGDSWGRIAEALVEQCTCRDGRSVCERTRYTVCSWNPCENQGTCRKIEATGEEVCACRSGYSGPFCSIVPAAHCYEGNGVSYRGTAMRTRSGARCLPWNSDLLFDELSLDRAKDTNLQGLGEHAFCRNPDKDSMPWCYTMQSGAVSWEYCDIPACDRRIPSTRLKPPPPRDRPTADPTRLRRPGRPKPKPKPAPRPIRPNKCGTRHQKRIPRGRILGGTSALPGSHPWMAAIYIGEEFCAGTLVHACWVVSAAHCFFRNPMESTIRVVLGQQVFNDTGPNTRTYGVEKYKFHPKYSLFRPTEHDIVLVKLERKEGRCARRTTFIRPICLPERNTTFPDFYCCQITGWGHMQETHAGEASYRKEVKYSHLMEGNVRIIPFDCCSRPDFYDKEMKPGMLCAGNNGCVDACQGDSGGPLACAKDGVSILYGIISWGDGCGRKNKPGVYTKVPDYIDWITTTIRTWKPPMVYS